MTQLTEKEKEDLLKIPNMYAKISFGYSLKYVMPYEAGIAVMNAFKHAEALEQPYDGQATITPIKDNPQLSFVSEEEYKKIKMEALLFQKSNTEEFE